MAVSKNYGQGRTRNFVTVLYPESVKENFKELISSSCVRCFLSPLHKDDKDPDGNPKKPHYHLLIMYDAVKSLEQAKEFVSSLGGVGCQKVNSLRGQARYLCHLDNPDKRQYNIEDVQRFGGADYRAIIGLQSDKYQSIREMIEFCGANQIYSYRQLLLYRSTNNEQWFRCLCDNGTLVMKEYLKSLKWSDRS